MGIVAKSLSLDKMSQCFVKIAFRPVNSGLYAVATGLSVRISGHVLFAPVGIRYCCIHILYFRF